MTIDLKMTRFHPLPLHIVYVLMRINTSYVTTASIERGGIKQEAKIGINVDKGEQNSQRFDDAGRKDDWSIPPHLFCDTCREKPGEKKVFFIPWCVKNY